MERDSWSPLELLKCFCESDYVERNADKAVECLSLDIHWFGTSDEEDVQNLDEARAYIEKEIRISPPPYEITFSDERERTWEEGFGIASVKMKIGADGLIMFSRVTCMTKTENGRSKICEMHTSIPEGHQEQGEYFPFEFAKQHESDVLRDFVNTMLPGGIFAMELGKDFPLAIINQNMLIYLGYRNEKEYLEAIAGRLSNAVHPEDRGLLRAAVLDTMDQGDEFKALLRIRKSDNSYFWGDIKGVRSRDSRGIDQIVCLCLDATNLVMANNQLKDDRLKLDEYASKLMEKEEIIQKDARQMRQLRQWVGRHAGVTDKLPKQQHVNWKHMGVIIASVILIIASVIGFTMYLSNTQWDAAVLAIRTTSLAGVQCISNATDADQAVLANMAEVLGKLYDRDEAADILQAAPDSGFSEMIASYDDGKCVSSGQRQPEEASDFAAKLDFPQGSNVSRPFWEANGKRQIAYRTDLYHEDKKAGVLYGMVNLSRYYVPSVMEFYDGQGFSCVIDARTGEFVIYSDRIMPENVHGDLYSALNENGDTKTAGEIRNALSGGKTGSAVVSLKGKKVYLYFVPVNDAAAEYLITMIPYDVIKEESSGMAYLVGAFVVVVLLAAVLLIIYNNRITKTKLREREYRNTLFRLLAENVDSVFLVFDHEADEVDYVSENIGRILGFESREILDHDTRSIKLPFDDEELERIQRIMKDKKNFYVDFPYSNPGSGKQQLLRLSGYVPEGADWQKKWIFCVSDRTDEVLKERRLEQAVREADEASKAKSEFLANMSHDIRTPMNGIIGMTQLALQDGVGEEAMRSYLKKISISSGFLLTLINDILDMSKIESGMIELHPKAYSMKELRRYLESVILPLSGEKQIDFRIDVDEKITVLADQQRFNQILFNLLSNAVKYTDEKGTVTLTIKGVPKDSGMIHLTMRVEDNGMGMSPEFQKQMFKSFTQESRKAMGMSGTGLGLAIVKRLVDLMNGTIHVESGIGKGSIFVIEMDVPAAKGPCEKELAADAAGDPTGQSACILLCEDNAINQEIMMGILEFLGLTTELAVNGKEGVEAFQSRKPGYYSAILMDCRMPVMDGYQATRAIRALERPDAARIPIIALTADAFEEDRKRCLEAGMDDFLAKPVEIKVLKEMLGKYMRKDLG